MRWKNYKRLSTRRYSLYSSKTLQGNNRLFFTQSFHMTYRTTMSLGKNKVSNIQRPMNVIANLNFLLKKIDLKHTWKCTQKFLTMFINSRINCSCTKQNIIKTNQITPFYKYCSLKTALKQKQSKTSGSNGSKVHIYPGWSLTTPFIAKGLKNVYDLEVLKKSSSLETLENYYNWLTFFVRDSALFCKFYNGDNNI